MFFASLRLLFVSFFLLFTIFFPATKLRAQDWEIPEEIVNITIPSPKILPGSLLFLAKRGMEKIQGVLRTQPFEKAEFALQLANRRLEEIEALTNLGETEEIGKNLERFQKEMEKTQKLVETLKDQEEHILTLQSRMVDLAEKHDGIAQALTKNLNEDLVEKFTETFGQAKKSFQSVMASIEKFQNQEN